MISIVQIAVAVILLTVLFLFLRKRNNTPPGPWGIPFVGTFFKMGGKPHHVFTEWAEKYGPIVHTRIGFKNVLILNNISVIQQAFSEKVFNGRPDSWVLAAASNGKHGVSSSEGQEWTEQRRFMLRSYRQIGFGKQTMHELILDEVTEMLEWIEQNTGIPVEVQQRLIMASTNALWKITAGERFDQDDPKLKEQIDAVTIKAGSVTLISLVMLYFPQVYRALPWMSETFHAVRKPIKDRISNVISSHLTSFTHGDEPSDFIGVYLKEIEKTADPNSTFYRDTGLHSLLCVVTNILGAGSGTTSTVLTWSVLYLAAYPDVQKKLQNELDEMTGKDGTVSLSDKSKAQYAEAVMLEVLRFIYCPLDSCIIQWRTLHSMDTTSLETHWSFRTFTQSISANGCGATLKYFVLKGSLLLTECANKGRKIYLCSQPVGDNVLEKESLWIHFFCFLLMFFTNSQSKVIRIMGICRLKSFQDFLTNLNHSVLFFRGVIIFPKTWVRICFIDFLRFSKLQICKQPDT